MILVGHAPGCTAGWTAVLDAPDWGDPDQARAALLICWACGRMVTLTAATPATERWDHAGEPAFTRPGIPAEHTPRLLQTRSLTERLPASIPPDRFAGVWLYVERVLDLTHVRQVLAYLVADDDGNVLGEVWSYVTPRGATRFRWGAPTPFGAPVAAGEGCETRGAAVRALLAAALPAEKT